MNGNYEWNKQFTRQKTQQRYREAELYRQARQQPRAAREQAKGYLHVWFGKIILQAQAVKSLPRPGLATRPLTRLFRCMRQHPVED